MFSDTMKTSQELGATLVFLAVLRQQDSKGISQP